MGVDASYAKKLSLRLRHRCFLTDQGARLVDLIRHQLLVGLPGVPVRRESAISVVLKACRRQPHRWIVFCEVMSGFCCRSERALRGCQHLDGATIALFAICLLA